LKIDVSKLIEVLQSISEFEDDLQEKFDKNKLDDLEEFESHVKVGDGGEVQIDSGSAKEIASRYKNKFAQMEKEKEQPKQNKKSKKV